MKINLTLTLSLAGTSSLSPSFYSQVYVTNVEAHRKKIELKFADFPAAKTFFLGQLGSCYNMVLIFYSADPSVDNFDKHLSEELAQVIYNLILIAVESIPRGQVSNGIFVHDDATNFFERNNWEFDGPLMKLLADSLCDIYASYVEGLQQDHFFRSHSVKVIVQKYGQNQTLRNEEVNHFGTDLDNLFSLERCAKIQMALAENFSQPADVVPLSPYFDLGILSEFLPRDSHFYGMIFSKKFGNFQTKGVPSCLEKVLDDFEAEEFLYYPGECSRHINVAAFQGYNTSKMYLRKQQNNIPFTRFDYTTHLSKSFHCFSPTQRVVLRDTIYQHGVFESLLAKIEELSKISFSLRLEFVYSFDCSELHDDEHIDFTRLLKMLQKLHWRLVDEFLSNARSAFIAFESSMLFESVYVTLSFFKSLMDKITCRHQIQNFSSFGDLELAFTIESLVQYMCTGCQKNVCLQSLHSLGCRSSLFKYGWVYFDQNVVDLSNFTIFLSNFKKDQVAHINLASQKIFRKSNKIVYGYLYDSLISFEIKLEMLRNEPHNWDSLRIACKYFLELLQRDFQKWFLKASKKRSSEQHRDLRNLLRDSPNFQALPLHPTIEKFFQQHYVKKCIAPPLYFRNFIHYVSKYGGQQLSLHPIGARIFDSLRTFLKLFPDSGISEIEESLIRAFCDVHREKSLLYYPLIYSGLKLSKNYIVKVCEPSKSDDLWISLNPCNLNSLVVSKIPLFERELEKVVEWNSEVGPLLEMFSPSRQKADALILIQSMFSSLKFKTAARRAKFMVLYIMLYLGIKFNESAIVKSFSKNGKFNRSDVNGSKLVSDKICTGEKHGLGFLNLKISSGLERIFDNISSVAFSSRERYYRLFGYSTLRLRDC